MSPMDYFPTLLKIVENGASANTDKVISYTHMLVDKLRDSGDKNAADKLLKAVTKAQSSMGLLPNALLPSTVPVDRDSRLSLADESHPQLNDIDIQLDDMTAASVEEFVSFVDNASKLAEAGVGISPSMLLYGPPGCGKSYLAQTIAARLKLPLLTARCDVMMSSLLGSTAKNIRNLFDHASNRPCVLFLDEFDALAKARDDQHELGELKRVVVSLLQNIDSLSADTVVIAATNHDQLLDPAVWRRFAYRLNLQLPSEEMRRNLLQQYLNGYAPKNLKQLVLATQGMSGALIKQACEAILRMMIIDKSSHIDENKLVARVAKVRFHDTIQSDESADIKIRQLKSMDSQLFTTRVLGEVFSISTGKVSKILNS